MGRSRLDGVPPSPELMERAVAALVREWGVSDTEAREALARAHTREHRLRRNGRVIPPEQPRVTHIAGPHPQLWRVYDDHGCLTLGRIEGVLPSWSLWHTRGRVA